MIITQHYMNRIINAFANSAHIFASLRANLLTEIKKLSVTIFLLLAIFCPETLTARENKDMMKANYYYTHFAYSEAIPYFEKLGETATTPAVFEKLGDCYRLTGNLEKAITSYEKATSLGQCNNATYLHYGSVLMRLSRYEDAKKQFTSYAEKDSSDSRIADLISSCTSAAERMRSEFPSGVIHFAPFNSNGADFAPTLWNGNLVYTSDTVIDTRKKTDKWSGNSYYSIYCIPLTAGKYGDDISKISGPKDLNIKYHTGPCTFSENGTEMYYTRSSYTSSFLSQKAVGGKDSTVPLEIIIASDYNASEKKFRTLTPFQHNSSSYSVAHPAISPNGKLLALSSDMPLGTGGRDIYICRAIGKDKWSKPVNAGSTVNTEGEEVFPWWADDATLYFSSDGHEGLGGLDIYRTTYNEAEGTFSKPENMPQPLNSPYDEMTLAMPANGRSGHFSSDRPAPTGGDNIYFYKHMKVFLQVSIVDSATGKPISARLTCRSGKSNKETTLEAGAIYNEQLWPNIDYTVALTRDQYKPATFRVTATSNSNEEQDTIFKKIALAPIIKTWDSTFAVTITETPAPRQGIMDTPGISKFEVNKVYVIGYFDFNFSKFYYKANQADVNVEKKVILDTLYNVLKRNPTMQIQIQAHSDCRGTDEYNMKLSIERAYSVVDYLRKRGIPKERLEYKGFGETMPVVPCPDCQACTEEEHAQNRVLEFKVLKI